LEHASTEAMFIGRIAGAALLAIGVASWMARTDTLNNAQLGLITGILVYDTAASILLAFADSLKVDWHPALAGGRTSRSSCDLVFPLPPFSSS
jgi:hypothetical protein